MNASCLVPDAGELPCIRCLACDAACPEGLPVLALWDALRSGRDDLAAAAGIDRCRLCAACDAACPSRIPLARRLHEAQSARGARSVLLHRAADARLRFEARAARLQRGAVERAEREAMLVRDASSEDAVAAAIARVAARRARKPSDEA
jgi:electron transport complex protein RnfC